MKIEKLTVEGLTGAQLEQMVQIERSCGLEPYPRELLLHCVADMETYGALDNGVLAGFLTVLPDGGYAEGTAYVVNLNVAQEYRRQGIARQLLCTVFASFPPETPIFLDVQKNNAPARALYSGLGFRDTELKSCNGKTDVVMVASASALRET